VQPMGLAEMRQLFSNQGIGETGPRSDAGRHRLISVDGREVAVTLRTNINARRIIMRMDRQGAGVTVTVPPGVGAGEALAFAREHRAWIATQLLRVARAVPFAAGAVIPYLDEPHEIVHRGRGRGTVERTVSGEGRPVIAVAGAPEHLERRLADWLKREAKRALIARATAHAQALDLSFSRLTVRDQSSRWGSCSSRGTLSFSWRLILAPWHVLDYVAAHEVAHLAEMNHSERFWRLVERVRPDMKRSRAWLRKNGAGLHLFLPTR